MKKTLLAVLMALALLAPGCARSKPATSDLLCMDTLAHIALYGPRARQTLAACEAELHTLETLLSATDPGSDLNRVRQSAGTAVSVDARTYAVLALALEAFEETDGAFDPTVLPLVDAWGFHGDDPRVPDAAQIARALSCVDGAGLRLADGTARIEAGMGLDLGGIAKGYAGARLRSLCTERGVKSALISLGGNVQTVGARPDGMPWRIGVMDPFDAQRTVGVVSVTDCAVVTAGAYQRYFEQDGARYHHILDPRTGYPAEAGLASVTVVAEDGAFADALSTALFVRGEAEARRLYAANGGFELLLVTSSGQLLATQGLSFEADAGYRVETITR